MWYNIIVKEKVIPMKNVELSLNELTLLRRALGLLENEAFDEVQRVGVDAFEETQEEKIFHQVSELYERISKLEEELEEEE